MKGVVIRSSRALGRLSVPRAKQSQVLTGRLGRLMSTEAKKSWVPQDDQLLQKVTTQVGLTGIFVS